MTRNGLAQAGSVRAVVLALFSTLFALLLPSAALAQMTPLDVASMFGTETGDTFSAVFLNQIFGPLFPTTAGAGVPTVFSIIIGYFNVIILVIGGLMFFYNVTVGIMQTAHEGSVLGQRWSSLWAPLRVVFAVGMLVPVPGLGGYNLSQSGIAYVVKGSTNVASAIWTTSAELVINGTTPITTQQPTVSDETVRIMYENAACQAIVNYQFQQAAGPSGSPLQVTFARTLLDDIETHTSRVIDPSDPTGSQNDKICGAFSTPELPAYISRIIEEDTGVQGLPSAQKDAVKTAFITTHTQVMRDLYADMQAITSSSGPLFLNVRDSSAGTIDISPQIIAARNRANESLATGMTNILNLALGADRDGQASRDALLSRIRGSCAPSANNDTVATCYGEGWIGAGSWYMMMAQLNNEIASLLNAFPSIEEGKYIQDVDYQNRNIFIASGGEAGWVVSETDMTDAGMISSREASLMNEKYKETYENSVIGMAALGEKMPIEHLSGVSGSVQDDWLDVLGLGDPAHGAIQFAVEMTSPSEWADDPLIGIVNFGQRLQTIGLTILAVAAVSDASVFGWSAGAGFSIVLMPIGMALVGAGAMMTYFLPLLPFIFWVLAVSGYFILIIEAIVAVNLWALGHLRMDGEGISGEAGKYGWLMLLSLMVTPTLMVFGFLVGMILFRVTSSLLDIGFNQALTGLLDAGIAAAIIGMIVYGIMLVSIYMVILERSFSLVSEFPGRVLRWMGADANLTKGEEDRGRVAAGVGTAATAKLFSSAGSGIGGRLAEARRSGKSRFDALGPKRGKLPGQPDAQIQQGTNPSQSG